MQVINVAPGTRQLEARFVLEDLRCQLLDVIGLGARRQDWRHDILDWSLE